MYLKNTIKYSLKIFENMNHVLVMSHFIGKDGIITTGFLLLNNQNNSTLLSGTPFLVFDFSPFFPLCSFHYIIISLFYILQPLWEILRP